VISSMTAALEGGEWSAARPGRTLPPGKTRYPFYRRLDGPQGRSGRAEKSLPHRDSILDRPARGQSLYRLSYPVHILIMTTELKMPTPHGGLIVQRGSLIPDETFRRNLTVERKAAGRHHVDR